MDNKNLAGIQQYFLGRLETVAFLELFINQNNSLYSTPNHQTTEELMHVLRWVMFDGSFYQTTACTITHPSGLVASCSLAL